MTATAAGAHRPTLVHYEHRHSVPAEVCGTCSDIAGGALGFVHENGQQMFTTSGGA